MKPVEQPTKVEIKEADTGGANILSAKIPSQWKCN